jgi:hypothetical protein
VSNLLLLSQAELATILNSSRAKVDRLERENAALRQDRAELEMLREMVGVHKNASACVNDATHWLKLMDAWDENAALRKALDEAATSLCTISQQAGRTEELSEISQIRGYAFSRYSAAIDAARAKEAKP